MEKWMKSKNEELIVGKSNDIAVRKAWKFVKGKDGYRFLFLYAGTGCGKTALTQAVKETDSLHFCPFFSNTTLTLS